MANNKVFPNAELKEEFSHSSVLHVNFMDLGLGV